MRSKAGVVSSRVQPTDPSPLDPVVYVVQLITQTAEEDVEYTEYSMLSNNDLETQLPKGCMKEDPTKFHYDTSVNSLLGPPSPAVSTGHGHGRVFEKH